MLIIIKILFGFMAKHNLLKAVCPSDPFIIIRIVFTYSTPKYHTVAPGLGPRSRTSTGLVQAVRYMTTVSYSREEGIPLNCL